MLIPLFELSQPFSLFFSIKIITITYVYVVNATIPTRRIVQDLGQIIVKQ